MEVDRTISRTPKFESPPIAEVALSVQFESPVDFRSIHVGLFWQTFRDQFPLIEQHPPQPPMIEKFGTQAFSENAIQITFADVADFSRTWFITADGTEVIQIQRDRITRNWRTRSNGQLYPGYEALRSAFLNQVTEFRQFLHQERLGDLKPIQWELSYVNELLVGHEHVADALTVWCDLRNPEGNVVDPETVSILTRYVLSSKEGGSDSPFGRLYLEVKPALRASTGDEIIFLSLTARGHPSIGGSPDLSHWLDEGHSAIIRTFLSSTSLAKQREWGLRDAD